MIEFSIPQPIIPGYYKTKKEVHVNSSFTGSTEYTYIGVSWDPNNTEQQVTSEYPYIYEVVTDTNFSCKSKYFVPKPGKYYVVSTANSILKYPSPAVNTTAYPSGLVGYVTKSSEGGSNTIKVVPISNFYAWEEKTHNESPFQSTTTFSEIGPEDDKSKWNPSVAFKDNSATFNWTKEDADGFNSAISGYLQLWEVENLESDKICDWCGKNIVISSKNIRDKYRRAEIRFEIPQTHVRINDAEEKTGFWGFDGTSVSLTSSEILKIDNTAIWCPEKDGSLDEKQLYTNLAVVWSSILTNYFDESNSNTTSKIKSMFSEGLGWLDNWNSFSFDSSNWSTLHLTTESQVNDFSDKSKMVCLKFPARFQLQGYNAEPSLMVQGVVTLRIHGNVWPDGETYVFHPNGNDYGCPLFFAEPLSTNYEVSRWSKDTKIIKHVQLEFEAKNYGNKLKFSPGNTVKPGEGSVVNPEIPEIDVNS